MQPPCSGHSSLGGVGPVVVVVVGVVVVVVVVVVVDSGVVVHFPHIFGQYAAFSGIGQCEGIQ